MSATDRQMLQHDADPAPMHLDECLALHGHSRRVVIQAKELAVCTHLVKTGQGKTVVHRHRIPEHALHDCGRWPQAFDGLQPMQIQVTILMVVDALLSARAST